MREAFFAELILSTVISPDRAASTLGDLLEERPARGRVWFWWSVLGAAASHLWQDLRLHPGWAIGRAFWGFGVTVAYMSALGLAIEWVRLYVAVDPAGGIPSWENPLGLVAIGFVFPLVVGWQNARRSPQRELASAVSMILMRICFNFLFAFWSAIQMRQIGKPVGLTEVPRIIAAASACMLFGAMLQRRRALRNSSSTSHA